jgi:hypothetical protein
VLGRYDEPHHVCPLYAGMHSLSWHRKKNCRALPLLTLDAIWSRSVTVSC